MFLRLGVELLGEGGFLQNNTEVQTIWYNFQLPVQQTVVQPIELVMLVLLCDKVEEF